MDSTTGRVQRILRGTSRGVSTAYLANACDSDGTTSAKRSLLLELANLLRSGRVGRSSKGNWHWAHGEKDPKAFEDTDRGIAPFPSMHGFGSSEQALTQDETSDGTAGPSADQLLRYYHAALRSDVRGRARLFPDRAGVSWHPFTAHGDWWPMDSRIGKLEFPLDEIAPDFRAALERRGNDDTIAIGWSLAAGRDTGLDCFWPTALLSARFSRSENSLHITLERPRVAVNPAWIRAQAGALGWNPKALSAHFSGRMEVGSTLESFARILREAAASHVRGQLWPQAIEEMRAFEPDTIYGSAALILPEEQSFNGRAVRDLDQICAWDQSTFGGTAIAPLLEPGSATSLSPLGAVLETGPLNAEQLDAVRNGLSKRLTIVTGPPGTGKSQTVSALVASAVLQGKRVLVAARTHQALDAVEDRIGGQHVMRTRDRDGTRDLSFRTAADALVLSSETRARELEDRSSLSKLQGLDARRSRAVEDQRARAEIEFRIADLLEVGTGKQADDNQGLLQRLLRVFFRRKAGPSRDLQKLRREARQIVVRDDPVAIGQDIRMQSASLLEQEFSNRASMSAEARSALGRRLADIDLEQTDTLPDDLVETILDARPVWLTTTLSAPARIPLHPGLFDLVIIDEASQADIASSLPVLARAKRAVVVGDDRQLSFIPSLGYAQERNLMRMAGITSLQGMGIFAQGTSSLFDLAKVQALASEEAAAVMLVEQYRSAPEITEFIGEAFYSGQLRPAVDPETLHIPKGAKAGLAWSDVAGREEPSSEGGYVNQAEVDAIAGHLETLLVEDGYTGTVGVVTPFNAQAGALKRTLADRIPEIVREAVELKVDTVDSFQGQERALIIFSPVAAGRESGGAARFLARDKRRINVAISRAQAVAHVFGDLSFARRGQVPALARLAARATEPRRHADDKDAGSLWERRLGAALRDAGLDPIPQYPIVGRRLDFALFKDDIKLDVEVDGRRWHLDANGQRKADDLFRDAQLKSAGWRVARFWVSELEEDMEACVERIQRELR